MYVPYIPLALTYQAYALQRNQSLLVTQILFFWVTARIQRVLGGPVTPSVVCGAI